MAESQLAPSEQLTTLWSLGGLTFRQLSQRVWRAIDEDNLLGRAAELAYNFILALFPWLLFLLALFGVFASHAATRQTNLLNYFSQALPPAAFHVISQTLAEVTSNAGGAKLTFGMVLTLWFASGGMTSMMSALNGVYGVRETRSWFKVRAIAVALTVAISFSHHLRFACGVGRRLSG